MVEPCFVHRHPCHRSMFDYQDSCGVGRDEAYFHNFTSKIEALADDSFLAHLSK